jgi:hypothetical protein
VFTSNPFFESWGHFPHSLRRLQALLRAHQPAGTVLISGDVHFAEVMGTPSDRGVDACAHGGAEHAVVRASHSDLVEVTSSGITHTSHSEWFGFATSAIIAFFGANRLQTQAAQPALFERQVGLCVGCDVAFVCVRATRIATPIHTHRTSDRWICTGGRAVDVTTMQW